MLSKQQEIAYKKINEWLVDKDKQEFMLAGYAGTGKTYLCKHLIENINKNIICCAPTGKAASVLRKRLKGKEVTTIHKILYNPINADSLELADMVKKYRENPSEDLKNKIKELRKTQRVSFSFKESNNISPNDLVIVDEASMVSERIRLDLKGTNAKVLYIGDPMQLPPVGASNFWFADNIDYCMTTIQRQAMDSPIIRLSEALREDTVKISEYQYEDCKITKDDNYNIIEFDQVITGKNFTRQQLNRIIRSKLGFTGELPQPGEKLICLKNNRLNDYLFINGMQFINRGITTIIDDCFYLDLIDDDKFTIDNVEFYVNDCRAHYVKDLIGSELTWEEKSKLLEIDFGYAITVHKSQGSEWDSVLVYDDKMQRENRAFRQRWLYTAVTRARSKLLWKI